MVKTKEVKEKKAKSGLMTSIQWLSENGYEKTVKDIRKLEAAWAEAGHKTRRCWKQVLLGSSTGKPVKLSLDDGTAIEFPMLAGDKSFVTKVWGGTVPDKLKAHASKRPPKEKKAAPAQADAPKRRGRPPKTEKAAEAKVAKAPKVVEKTEKRKPGRPKKVKETAEEHPQVAAVTEESKSAAGAAEEAGKDTATATSETDVKAPWDPAAKDAAQDAAAEGTEEEEDEGEEVAETPEAAEDDEDDDDDEPADDDDDEDEEDDEETVAKKSAVKEKVKAVVAPKPKISLSSVMTADWQSEKDIAEKVASTIRSVHMDLHLLEQRGFVVGRAVKGGGMEWHRVKP